MARKRDSAYYRERLRKEFPKIYAELQSGRIKSVRAAAIRAGLIQLPTRLDALKREWKRSTPVQRRDFLIWVRANYGGKKAGAPTVADQSGRLTPAAITFLGNWTKKNRLTPGQIMKQMGFRVNDYTLSYAILRGGKLRPDVIQNLKKWMPANGFR
jgi:hypothetical protein